MTDEEKSSWRTINERAIELGIEMTRKQAWIVGERVSSAWYEKFECEPHKPLVAKRFGSGTHHIAKYPPSFFGEIDSNVIDACASGGQGLLFDQVEQRMTNHFDNIREWAHVRNITIGCTVRDQFLKLIEEVGELAQAIAKDDDSSTDFVDAIGDCVVVLTILADQHGTTIERCIEHAWNEIKDRRGRVINGTWVKES